MEDEEQEITTFMDTVAMAVIVPLLAIAFVAILPLYLFGLLLRAMGVPTSQSLPPEYRGRWMPPPMPRNRKESP